jgi:mRNA interferase RelE/StbE
MENTIVQMTQDEFKEMLESVVEETVERKLLEILGDPDEGLEIRSEVRERLLRQRQDVMGEERGRPFEDVVQEFGLEWAVYQVRILEEAARDLAKVDAAVARRVVSRIRWLAEDLDDIQPEALTGNLAGFYKLRAGDYRVVYEIVHSEQMIIIHLVGHRREIYRK